jgi:phenylpropionate dioxygenase-like ring-hydroxylating dioxygenase large terminal subunit
MLSAADNELLTRVSPTTPMGTFLRRFWTPALPSDSLPGPDCDPVELRLLGEDLVAFRDASGKIGILDALCPHRQAPLFFGRNEECGLRCIYHGWKFDVDGYCVDMPSEPPESDFRNKVKRIGYPVREWSGMIWVYLGPPHLEPELPQLEWTSTSAGQRSVVLYNQECNFVQAIEGDIDSSHIGFLHMDLGTLKRPQTTEMRWRANDRHPRWIVEPTDYGLMLAARRDAEPETFYWRINQFFFPYYTTIAGSLDQTRGHGHIWVPVDDTHTQVWCVIWATDAPLSSEERYAVLHGPNPHIASLDPVTGKLRATKANHYLQDRAAQRNHSFTGILGTREQDTAVVEGMGAIVDRTKEHLGTSDMAIIGMRRQLLDGAKALMGGTEPAAAFDGGMYHARAWSKELARSTAETFLEDPRVQQLMAGVAG